MCVNVSSLHILTQSLTHRITHICTHIQPRTQHTQSLACFHWKLTPVAYSSTHCTGQQWNLRVYAGPPLPSLDAFSYITSLTGVVVCDDFIVAIGGKLSSLRHLCLTYSHRLSETGGAVLGKLMCLSYPPYTCACMCVCIRYGHAYSYSANTNGNVHAQTT